MADVARLSDEELVEELRRYGEDPGPIVETTRGLYQKKLARLMGEKAKGWCIRGILEQIMKGLPTSASSDIRSGEGVDYGTDKLGEWSSHSSEGETDPEGEGEGEGEEEEEEEEAGALPEPSASVRQRSSTTKVVTCVVLPEVLVNLPWVPVCWQWWFKLVHEFASQVF